MSRQEALDALWKQQGESSYKEGVYQGTQEGFAAAVVYGEVTVLGRTVPVTFGWPDEEFAATVRSLAGKVLERAHREGRQVRPPSEAGEDQG